VPLAALRVPQLVPVQFVPERVQFTATFAVNGWVAFRGRLMVAGETVTDPAAAGLMVTDAVAVFVLSAWEVAVTVTVFGFGTAAGGVYAPELSIVPQFAPEHPVPETLQVTAVLLDPVTVAVKEVVVVDPAVTVAVVGETDTPTTTGAVMVTVAVALFVASA
jgi:hypothetical protein